MKHFTILFTVLISLFLGCKETIIQEIIPKEYTNDLLHADLVGKIKQSSSSAMVYISQQVPIDSARIATDGSFAFRDLRAGTYDLKIVANNYRIYKRYNVLLQGGSIYYAGEIDLSTTPDLIESYYPENKAEIVYDWRYGRLTISILFSQPMDRESVEKSFSTYPASEGIFYWGAYTRAPRSDIYADANDMKSGFDPGATITTFSKITSMTYILSQKDTYMDSTYTVTLSTNAKDTAGNRLRFPLSFTFRTVQSYTTQKGIQTNPVHGDINVDPLYGSGYGYGGIQITFPRRMNPASTEAAITITPQMTTTFLWPEENILRIYTGGPLLADTTITISIKSTAKDKDGVELGQKFSFYFRTAPLGITYTSPNNAQVFVAPTSQIILTFNSYVQLQSAKDAFSISPAIGGTITYGGYAPYENPNQIVFTPSGSYQPNTKYTVTLSTALKDLYGVPLKKAYSFSFITRPN